MRDDEAGNLAPAAGRGGAGPKRGPTDIYNIPPACKILGSRKKASQKCKIVKNWGPGMPSLFGNHFTDAQKYLTCAVDRYWDHMRGRPHAADWPIETGAYPGIVDLGDPPPGESLTYDKIVETLKSLEEQYDEIPILIRLRSMNDLYEAKKLYDRIGQSPQGVAVGDGVFGHAGDLKREDKPVGHNWKFEIAGISAVVSKTLPENEGILFKCAFETYEYCLRNETMDTSKIRAVREHFETGGVYLEDYLNPEKKFDGEAVSHDFIPGGDG